VILIINSANDRNAKIPRLLAIAEQTWSADRTPLTSSLRTAGFRPQRKL
jgi:hypothetical protein